MLGNVTHNAPKTNHNHQRAVYRTSEIIQALYVQCVIEHSLAGLYTPKEPFTTLLSEFLYPMSSRWTIFAVPDEFGVLENTLRELRKEEITVV